MRLNVFFDRAVFFIIACSRRVARARQILTRMTEGKPLLPARLAKRLSVARSLCSWPLGASLERLFPCTDDHLIC